MLLSLLLFGWLVFYNVCAACACCHPHWQPTREPQSSKQAVQGVCLATSFMLPPLQAGSQRGKDSGSPKGEP
eukprot:1160861-Pelagomonas_calceolata.AAC.5